MPKKTGKILMGASLPDCKWQLPEKRKPLTRRQFAQLYLAQNGACACCARKLGREGTQEVEIIDEHLQPLWALGSNDLSNRELWCKECATVKTGEEATQRAKEHRVRDKFIGAWKPKGNPIPGSRRSAWKKTVDGRTIKRK